MHKCSLYWFRIVYLSDVCLRLSTALDRSRISYTVFRCFFAFVVIFCFLLFLFYGFDWYSYRLRLRLTSFAMQLQTETRNAAACAEQQPVAVKAAVAGLPNWVSDSLIVWFRFWPTRIKYIYLMHLQNIDDVQRSRCRCRCHCLSFWWEACGSTEHLTPLGAQLSSPPNTAEAKFVSVAHFLRLYDISP